MDAKTFLDNFETDELIIYPVLPPLPQIPNNVVNKYSPSSIKTYKTSLSKLPDYGIDIHNLIDIDTIMNKLLEKLEHSTVIGYLSAILWYSKENNINSDKYEDISKKIGEYYKIKTAILSKNELSEKNKDKYLPWSSLMLVHTRLCPCITSSSRHHMYYVLLSLYVLYPPRRVLDYVCMRVCSSVCIDTSLLIPRDGYALDLSCVYLPVVDLCNYYVDKGESGYFVFNNYKTSAEYGTQYLELSDDLHMILKSWVSLNKLSEGDSLLNLCHSNFCRSLSKIFVSYTSRRLTVNDLRHIYISHMRDSGKLRTGRDQLKLSRQMGHSVSTQQDYYKNVDGVADGIVFDRPLCKL